MTPSLEYRPLAGQLDVADLVVPDWVKQVAGGTSAGPVWRNELGGITYSIDGGQCYLKAQPADTGWDLDAEASRLAWVAGFVPAPRVLASGERDDLRWLLTVGLPGRSAVQQPWIDRPATTVPALGRALRRFHDRVPAASCPFSWSVADRIARFGLSATLMDDASALDPVVCHGDACNPNFLVGADGEVCGYVDLGNLGVGDRWADLAPALMSLGWNYGPGWERAFLDAYGIDPDPAKQAFYTQLWNAEDEPPTGYTPP